MMSDLNMSRGKMPDTASIPLFALTFVMKLRDFDFTMKYFTIFVQKNDVRFECVPWKNLILFHFLCACLLLSKKIW